MNLEEIQQSIKELQHKLDNMAVANQPPKPARMTKEERIVATWKLPELPKNYIDMFGYWGFKTGSSEYSDATPADVDWVLNVPPYVFSAYCIEPDNEGYWEDDGFSSVYCHHHGQLYNILCMSDINLHSAWEQATNEMRSIFKNGNPVYHEAFNVKWKRVRVFRALKDILAPTRLRNKMLDQQTALNHRLCKICTREAIWFSTKRQRLEYLATGICEPCRTEFTKEKLNELQNKAD